MFALELVGPVLAERRSRTPWHARHIAERHGLLVIITLGEGVLGTVVALSALMHTEHGWTFDAALLAVAGSGLTFGLWWMYFLVPWGEVLERHRERSMVWGSATFCSSEPSLLHAPICTWPRTSSRVSPR